MKTTLLLWFVQLCFALVTPSLTQAISLQPDLGKDTIRVDYKKIYSYALDANIRDALALLPRTKNQAISKSDQDFMDRLERRFGFSTDQSAYIAERSSSLDTLLSLYQTYWRKSLLEPDQNYDTLLLTSLSAYFSKRNRNLAKIPDDSLNRYMTQYINSLGYRTTGLSKTGRLFDLLVWKTQRDTTYKFSLSGEQTSARVVFMDDFITLGWEEYATLGRYYPSGWATREAIYCVRKAYNLNSEEFLVSFLAHESRHFADYQLFPNLSPADLEYRAKLTELFFSRTTLYALIDSFLANANYNSDNSHPVANYCVIRDLSRTLFGKEFERTSRRWHELSKAAIQQASTKLLRENTTQL